MSARSGPRSTHDTHPPAESDDTRDSGDSGESDGDDSSGGSDDSGDDSEGSEDDSEYSHGRNDQPPTTHVEEEEPWSDEEHVPPDPSHRALWRVSIATSDSTDLADMKRLIERWKDDVSGHERPEELAEALKDYAASPELRLASEKQTALTQLATVIAQGRPLEEFYGPGRSVRTGRS